MNLLYFISGDAPFFFAEQIKNFLWLPPVWDASNGFGQNSVSRLWVDYPFRLIVKLLSSAGFSWFIIEKLLWLSVLILVLYTSFRLARYILGKTVFTFLAPVIYGTNTYVLLLFSGGQLGVALAYGLAPFVLLKFIQTVDTQSGIRHAIQNGLWLALLIVFDLRLAYLVVTAALLYQLINIRYKKIRYTLIIPFLVAAVSHAFWILPAILIRGASLSVGEQFTSSGMLRFLSFADFSHAISLLHPNWPENLFGKVYFLQPEFLVLPLLAFSALAWIGQKAINNKQNSFTASCLLSIRFFAFLSLFGIFLAKGVNPPFGGIYNWLFNNVPGFVMFRDPTKFYLFIAIGYSILIPFTLEQIIERAKSFKHVICRLLLVAFIIFWYFTVRAVFIGQVAGNFRPFTLMPVYIQLKNELINDTIPSRTLWVPRADKFVFSSDVHPVLSSDELFHNASVSAMMGIINTPEFSSSIRENGVGYVIVPQDLEKKIFLTDYKYDGTLRQNLIDALDASYLQPVSTYNGLKVYKSSHEPMVIKRPLNVDQQQYWANIGMVVSGASLIIVLGLLFILRK